MHWRNSNFQYVYFIFGACHTPIEAHRKCMEAIEDRELALSHSHDVKADGEGAESRHLRANVVQAEEELEFLNRCREKLEKKIGFIPTMADYQENQRTEWRLELEHRAENYLLTTGTIPTDHFATMRMHPDFEVIFQKINQVRASLQNGEVPALVSPEWKQNLQGEMEGLFLSSSGRLRVEGKK